MPEDAHNVIDTYTPPDIKQIREGMLRLKSTIRKYFPESKMLESKTFNDMVTAIIDYCGTLNKAIEDNKDHGTILMMSVGLSESLATFDGFCDGYTCGETHDDEKNRELWESSREWRLQDGPSCQKCDGTNVVDALDDEHKWYCKDCDLVFGMIYPEETEALPEPETSPQYEMNPMHPDGITPIEEEEQQENCTHPKELICGYCGECIPCTHPADEGGNITQFGVECYKKPKEGQDGEEEKAVR